MYVLCNTFMRVTLITSFLIVFVAAYLSSCRKERFRDSSSVELRFDQDTILFDTVFSTIGSTTKFLKVYNPYDENIRIDEIRLEGGTSSQFRINVNGDNGPLHTNIEIRPNDSLFIFVEVTVDPGNINTPFIVEDFIRFSLGEKEQKVVLNAWGQDAYFHGGLGSLFVLPCSEVWNNDKPHVIYGIVAVDENCELTINAGTQVYCHAKSGLYVFKGTLDINGQLGQEVVFQGDRLEASYQDLPGQWGIQLEFLVESGGAPTIASVARGGIWIVQSDDSEIDYAILKNGGMGIQVDSVNAPLNSNTYALRVSNTIIQNMSGIGLWGQGGAIKGTNLLVADCGEGCAYFSIGGKYTMDNCTFANYWDQGTRTAPAFALNNYYEDINEVIQVRSLVNCRFTNCILFGSNAFLSDFSETILDLNTPESQDIQFTSCLVDTDINIDQDGRFVNCVNGQAPPFCSASESNFKLSGNSNLVLGIPNGVPSDIRNESTGDFKGCYDYLPGCN